LHLEVTGFHVPTASVHCRVGLGPCGTGDADLSAAVGPFRPVSPVLAGRPREFSALGQADGRHALGVSRFAGLAASAAHPGRTIVPSGRALGIFALRSLKSCPQVLGRYRPSQPACRFLNGRSAFFWRGTGAQYAFRARGAGQGPFTAAPGFSRGQAVPFRHVAALGFSSSRSSDATATSTVAARRPGLVTWAGHRPRDSASGPCRS
jgi:hypothetical protein